MKIALLIVCLGWISVNANAQQVNRLKPGQMYGPGEGVYAPRFGFKSKIPQGWEGTLPREAEIFLLIPIQPIDATIYILGNENDSMEALKARWKKGIDMGDNITLRSKGEFVQRGQAIAVTGDLAGSTNNNGRTIYAEGRCSEFGICVSFVLVVGNSALEAGKKALQDFVDQATFDQPKNISIYDGFDWKKFLDDEMIISYEANEKSTKSNTVHLCHDGTFQSSIKRKGLLKQEAKQFQGNKKGTWTVTKGQSAVLSLVFKDGSKADIDLRIEDEKVYANGHRHYVAVSDKCK